MTEAAQSILLTDDAASPMRWHARWRMRLASLPAAAIAGESWRRHGAIILVRDWEVGAALTDRLAPEHLQVMVREPRALFTRIRHAGAAFLGATRRKAWATTWRAEPCAADRAHQPLRLRAVGL
jgi:histidinol dehydrogenase